MTIAARDGHELRGPDGRILAARVEQKNGETGNITLDKESPIQAGCGKAAREELIRLAGVRTGKI